ncbi:MAG: FGGY family carbohydrate kinase [Candidatus Bipolaricaulota bacterium]
MGNESLVIGFDLGTSGCKAILMDADGNVLAVADASYSTYYPTPGRREQDPNAWWDAVVQCTKTLLENAGVSSSAIACCGVSGHSLGVVPVGEDGGVLLNRVPIWSDGRADAEAAAFFERVDECQWYAETGNGFPRQLYAVFKMMWYLKRMPDLFRRTAHFLGTKDYINLRLTGKCATDPSYASGSGLFSLHRMKYVDGFVDASGIPSRVLPNILSAHTVLGCLTDAAAAELGLTTSTRVVIGGVDNACMALGAKSYVDGSWYVALGSSSWIAVSSTHPILDSYLRPYVFAHVVPEQYTSALSMFSAGTSLQWIINTLCASLVERARKTKADLYEILSQAAAQSPLGANGLLFDPTMAGATAMGGTSVRRGALLGLELRHGEADILRAALEGIGFELRYVFEHLRVLANLDGEMLLVGGASRSSFWREVLADILGVRVRKTSVDQQAASLGAAALAAVGCGLWEGFDQVDEIHTTESIAVPKPHAQSRYDDLYHLYLRASESRLEIDKALSELGRQREASQPIEDR